MSSSLRPSTGRAELLSWINTLCVTNYSTVSHLSDAVAYCTVVELLIPNNKLLDRLPSFDCNADDYGDDLRPSKFGGALNARQLLERRGSNCRYLEHLLRSVAPSKWSLQLSPDRLAAGKLQDHMILLVHLNKWFCSHISAGNDGRRLNFVDGLDPASRRIALTSTSTISPSLMIPRNAPIRDAHQRFLDAVGISHHDQGCNIDQDDDVLENNERSHSQKNSNVSISQKIMMTSENNNSNYDFQQIHVDLDDAAVQLEARREQLERDAVSLKALVAERDKMKLKLRKAYENLMLVGHQQQQQHQNEVDGAAGFKMDIEKLFQEASNGKGMCTAEQILFKAMQKIPQ